MCRASLAADSTAFDSEGGQPTKRQQQRMVLDKLAAEAFVAQKIRAGSPRLVLDLCDQGYSYDRKTVAASMQRQNLRARAVRKYKATTNSKHHLPVAPNLLAQDFSASAPNQKWVRSGPHFPTVWRQI